MNPSAVTTTALPPPISVLPRPLRVTRRLATEGVSCSATPLTTREYASSASSSSGRLASSRPAACGPNGEPMNVRAPMT